MPAQPATLTTTATTIFPIPRECEQADGLFTLNEQTQILLPQNPSEHDLFLARSLAAELSDRYGLGVRAEPASTLPSGSTVIVMGAGTNPLVAELCAARGLDVTPDQPGPEGYALRVEPNTVLIAGSDEPGAFYGLQSLRQLIEKDAAGLRIPCLRVRDWPHKTFRGVRLYLPGRDNIPFFKRFLRDFMGLCKFNKLILEVNAGMRFDRHPELNAGWIEFARDLTYRRLNYPAVSDARGGAPNSTHYDTADGGVLEKEEVADIIQYARKHHIEVIPEMPGLTHSYYLLTRHREIAETPDEEWPDTYCPSNPASYELMFDVFDEYIEVMQPKMAHIGHDEWFLPDSLICERCKGKNRAELYAQDVVKIHGYLAGKGIRVAMWGDHFVKRLGRHGALSEEQVNDWIPKDILIFNWFWSDRPGDENAGRPGWRGEDNDISVREMGFDQIYGNMGPEIADWERRSNAEKVFGGAPSSWAATTEWNFGKDLVERLLRCANLLWAVHWPEKAEMVPLLRRLYPIVRRDLRGAAEPSDEGDPVVSLDIAAAFNLAADDTPVGQALPTLAPGTLSVLNKTFLVPDSNVADGRCGVVAGVEGEEKNPLPREAGGIRVGRDVSSLVFLHACARPSKSMMCYHSIYNFADSADLLGWYEVVYEDGLVETIPIRYGVNILEWGGAGLYGADPVACGTTPEGKPATFFAFEWRNPRFGKRIEEVRLKGSIGAYSCRIWRGGPDKLIPNNAVVLLALSVVEKRP